MELFMLYTGNKPKAICGELRNGWKVSWPVQPTTQEGPLAVVYSIPRTRQSALQEAKMAELLTERDPLSQSGTIVHHDHGVKEQRV